MFMYNHKIVTPNNINIQYNPKDHLRYLNFFSIMLLDASCWRESNKKKKKQIYINYIKSKPIKLLGTTIIKTD